MPTKDSGSAKVLRGEGLPEATLGGGAMQGLEPTPWDVFKARWTREHPYLSIPVLRCHWPASFWSTGSKRCSMEMLRVIHPGNSSLNKVKCVSLPQDFYEPSIYS